MRIFFAACSSQDTGPCYFALRASFGTTEKMPNNNNIFCSVSSWPDTDLLNCQAYAHCGLLCAVSTKYRDQARTLMRGRERWLVVVTSCARSRVRSLQLMCHTTLQTDKPAQPAWTCSLGSSRSDDQEFNCIVYGYGEASTFSHKNSFSIESY